jgi:hypothetical protein
MAGEKLHQVLQVVDPAKRDFLKKLVVGAAFAVPTMASFSVKDLAQASAGSPITTSTRPTPTTTPPA